MCFLHGLLSLFTRSGSESLLTVIKKSSLPSKDMVLEPMRIGGRGSKDERIPLLDFVIICLKVGECHT